MVMLYEVGKSESGEISLGEMDNEVLIGKAKPSFPGRGTAMRRGKNPSTTGWDLTGRGGTRMSE